MSGLDYTKKTEIRNPLYKNNEGVAKRMGYFFLNFWYGVLLGYRTRGEKWLMICIIITHVVGLIVLFSSISYIERPANIQIICPEHSQKINV